LWNTTRLLAVLSVLFFALLLALFVWMALDAKLAWLAFALLGVAVLLIVSAFRHRSQSFDIRR
jgi:multisubunit Na+/H+ antiporter MnhB subunit